MAEAAFLGDHECPVCHEDFTEPKLLPCTHRVCKKCVLSWLQSEGEGGCPLCRVPILSDACERVSATNCDITALVESLLTDLATVALVESKTALSGQHVCGLCDVTGNSVSAVSFCLDCSMKLCVSCVKAHQKIPATRQHVLEQLRTLTAEHLASSRRSPCDSHADRPAELYCPGHQTLICLLCATSKHRACSDVEGIADVAKKERATLKKQVERLRQKEAAITAEIAALEQEVVDTQKHFQTAKDDVVLTFGRLKEMLEKRCQEFISTLQSQEDKLISGKKAEKPQLDQQRAAISTQARSLDQLLASSPDSALVGMLNKLKQRLASLERQPHARKQQEGGLSKVKFDTQKMASLQHEIAALGWVVNENLQKAAQSDPVSEMPSAEHTVGNKGVEPRPSDRVMAFDPLTATPRRTFCMDISQLKIQGDVGTPYITSLVVTDGGKIVMTDLWNNKVKVMDSRTLTIVSSLSLGVRPWGLALLHDKLVAVTPYSDDVIHLIDVTVTVKRRLQEQVEKVELRVVRQIKTVRWYGGVGCGGEDGTLVVSCDKQGKLPASVDILSREGQVLKTVVIGEKLRGLCFPHYLCVVNGVALVSDVLSHCIHRVDLATGRVLSPITHDQLKSPYQVSADRSGNLYIASCGGGCVLVMGVDGRWRTLLRGEEHGEGVDVKPVSVTVTDTGVVVGWDSIVGSVVTGFDLT